MKVLFDTNVVLDVLLRRQPFYEVAVELFIHVETGKLEGFSGATTVTTLSYFMEKKLGKRARSELHKLLSLFKVTTIDQGILEGALHSPVGDYEDGVLVEAARLAGVDAIVTRNIRDFERAPLTAFALEELLAVLEVQQTLKH